MNSIPTFAVFELTPSGELDDTEFRGNLQHVSWAVENCQPPFKKGHHYIPMPILVGGEKEGE